MLANKLPASGWSFDQLLLGLCRLPPTVRRQLLRTCWETRYFSNDAVLFRAAPSEMINVDSMHWDALAAEPDYAEVAPYDLRMVLPKYLGRKVLSAKFLGDTSGTPLILLEGKCREAIADARAFATLNERYPKAIWRWAWGEEYWRQPVVLLDGGLMTAGLLLGALPLVQLRREGRMEPPAGRKRFVRKRAGNSWRYEQYMEPDDAKNQS